VVERRPRARLVLAVLLVGGALVACYDDAGDDDSDRDPGSTRSMASQTASTDDETTTPAGASLGEFPEQPAGVPWPTREWAEAAWPDGVDKAAVDAATDTAFHDGAGERVRAVVIVHVGAKVYERYSPHPDDGPNEIMPSYSMAKAVTSAMIGILVRDGRLDIDEPAAVPEWHDDLGDPRAAITVRHMLHMATGIPWDDGHTSRGSEMYEMVRSDDAAGYAAALRPTAEPGERFDYSSGTTTLLARIIGDEVGGDPEDVRAFLHDELFDKIGMDPVNTAFDAAGTWQGGYSADTTAQDFAKLGLLFLRGGEWDGEQILPQQWVELARTPSPAEPEYGAHWWLDPLRPGVFYAVGIRGNVITVDPAHDVVIVQLGTVAGSLPLAHTEAILDAFAALDQ
jgi:CubicO group peptidase (beta-lactamase class C family)